MKLGFILLFFCVCSFAEENEPENLTSVSENLTPAPENLVPVTELPQKEIPNVKITVTPGIVAAISADIGEDEEPVKDVDIYIMTDITKMLEHQRRRVAVAVAEMVEELKSANVTRHVRLALGTLVNRNIGSHHGMTLRERRKKQKASKSLRKATKMLKNCHGKKCVKWYKLKQFHQRHLTPIIQTSYRHQMNFTEDLDEMIKVFTYATKRGFSFPVSSQWEALLQASGCPEVTDWSNSVQRILLYISADGILEPQAYNHRRLSRAGLRCPSSNHLLRNKLEKGKNVHVKLNNGKVAQYLMQSRVRLLVGVPYSKKAFVTKRIFKSVPYTEVFAFGKTFTSFGEKASTKVESMINNKNGIIHNAPYPLIVRNVARPCTKRQLKKAAKKNKQLTCSEDGAQGWNITVEITRCQKRRPIENPVYFNIWVYAYNSVLGVNTTISCPGGNQTASLISDEEDESEIAALNEGEGEALEAVTEDPDEATEKDVDDNGLEAELTPAPIELDEEPPHEPDAEVIETESEVIADTELEVPDKEESGTCLSVRDCVVCNIEQDKDAENCGDCSFKHTILEDLDTGDLEKCEVKLDDNCQIEYYILPEQGPTTQVVANMRCSSDDEDDNEIF